LTGNDMVDALMITAVLAVLAFMVTQVWLP
jgi:hypothetical protein